MLPSPPTRDGRTNRVTRTVKTHTGPRRSFERSFSVVEAADFRPSPDRKRDSKGGTRCRHQHLPSQVSRAQFYYLFLSSVVVNRTQSHAFVVVFITLLTHIKNFFPCTSSRTLSSINTQPPTSKPLPYYTRCPRRVKNEQQRETNAKISNFLRTASAEPTS